MKLSNQRLTQAGWSDPEGAKQLTEALENLGLTAHYAETAVMEGPEAVQNLVNLRQNEDPAWAEKAQKLIAGSAKVAPAVGDAPGAGGQRFKMEVMTGQVDLQPGGGVEPIRFYKQEEDFGAFSNFSNHPFVVETSKGQKLTAPTSEHFFQAVKFMTSDEAYAADILAAATPKDAATMGRNRDRPMRNDWESIKDDVMRIAVASKVTQHDGLVTLLQSTGDAPIIEHAPHDSYWGNAFELGGKGKNMLGKIFEEVRAALTEARVDDYIANAKSNAGL